MYFNFFISEYIMGNQQKPLTQKKNRKILWWILMFSPIIVGILRILISFVFYIFVLVTSDSGILDPWLMVIKSLIDYVLGFLWIFSLLGVFVWIFILASSNDYDPYIDLSMSEEQKTNIYDDDFDLNQISDEDKTKIMNHGIKKIMPLWKIIIFSIISLGIFPLVYYSRLHSQLIIINKKDFNANKAVGY